MAVTTALQALALSFSLIPPQGTVPSSPVQLYSLHPQNLCMRQPFFMNFFLSSPSLTTLFIYFTVPLGPSSQDIASEKFSLTPHLPSTLPRGMLCFASTYDSFINDSLLHKPIELGEARAHAPCLSMYCLYLDQHLAFNSPSICLVE